jgi:hypothetical protein
MIELIPTIPEACLAYTQVFQVAKFENAIMLVVGIAMGVGIAVLHGVRK